MSEPRGFFISFEGSEGCGKSTQIRALGERLRAGGCEPLVTREPGGTPVGEAIRHLLQHTPEAEGMCPEAELLLFAASRAQIVREVIAPALAAGIPVIADRFMDSTAVYQGIARPLRREDVTFINAFAVGATMPDITFLLDMDSGEARRRIAARAGADYDRMEREPDDFYEAVRQGYLDLARAEPDRFCVLDAAGEPDAIAAAIWNTLTDRFPHLHGIQR